MTTNPKQEPETDSNRRSEDDLIEAALRQERGPATARPARRRLPTAIGRYKIIRWIGAGGMGVVYEAEQANPQRRVALKVTRAPTGVCADDFRLFEREIQALARLQHPSIARIYEADQTEEGQPYFVMEFIHGLPLIKHCRSEALPLNERLTLFAQVCEAVQYAHLRGVVHRDLKPANILVDDDGLPHVLDFGLAKIIDPDMKVTQTLLGGQAFLGTLPYMSPEQVSADATDVDFRADVYSLGVILYEMLTGRFPYEVVGHLAAVLRTIAEAEPVRPSSIMRRISGEIETVVLHALNKDRNHRYQTVDALREDVQRYLHGEPLTVKPNKTWYTLRKLAARHAFATAVLATVAVTILSFSAISGEYYLRARFAEQQKNQSDVGAIGAEQKAVAYQQLSLQAVRRLALGWFLAAWHQDHLPEARRYQAGVRSDSAEYAVMEFLLNDAYDEDRLRRNLPHESEPLLYLALGEKELKAGNVEAAMGSFERGATSAVGDLLLRAFVETRLKEARTTVNGAPSGEGR